MRLALASYFLGRSRRWVSSQDGRAKAMSTVSSKVDAAALSGAKVGGKGK